MYYFTSTTFLGNFLKNHSYHFPSNYIHHSVGNIADAVSFEVSYLFIIYMHVCLFVFLSILINYVYFRAHNMFLNFNFILRQGNGNKIEIYLRITFV